eukprot:gb/GEZJ01001446.1/.p1 GENE.gb/GEZJ01001446.1/~~gb/GEZJ01001446.1/.p1  ORF type:complete len:217 (-),score=33.72 gb/GEZJ01001446.1/:2104-2754(-)
MKTVTLAKDVVRSCSSALRRADEVAVLDKVFPTVDHALKRQTNGALPAVNFMLRGLRTKDVCIGACKILFPTLQQASKSSDEAMRAYAFHLAEELGHCVNSENVLLKIAVHQTGFLKTARYGYQKNSTLRSIAVLECASRRSKKIYEEVLQDIFSILSSKKEKSTDVRLAGFLIIVQILSEVQSGTEVPEIVRQCTSLLFYEESQTKTTEKQYVWP